LSPKFDLEIVEKLRGFEKPTPIQAFSIPIAAMGRDLIGLLQRWKSREGLALADMEGAVKIHWNQRMHHNDTV